jgi:hypothetical protein
MADNAYKRGVANRALMILNAGLTSGAGVLFTTIDDTEFANYTTVSIADSPDKRLVCFLYERILKQVLEDIQPDFACEYADLSYPYMVNQECGGWDYLFELPSNFLCLVAHEDEGAGRVLTGHECEVLHFKGYAHTVVGSDDNVYYCSTAHTSVDDSSDGQPPDDDGDSNWTLDSTELMDGATWQEDVSYLADGTGPMLAGSVLNNDAGTGAYIRYVAYVQAGRSDQPQYYPEAFINAFATRLAAEMCLDSKDYERRRQLLQEYESLAKPAYWHVENRHKGRTRHYTAFERRTRD